jgi:hypothetical protein
MPWLCVALNFTAVNVNNEGGSGKRGRGLRAWVRVYPSHSL